MMKIHIVKPKAPGTSKVKAVILLQEAFGVNAHMLKVASKVANEGYLVAVPELFHRFGQGLTFGYDEFEKVKPLFAQMKNAEVVDDIKATLLDLEREHGVPSNEVAVVGFCMGGLAAMMAATEPLPIAGAVSFYGGGIVENRPGIGVTPVIQNFKNIRCPVLLHFGDRDGGIPMEQVEKIREALAVLKTESEIVVYPGAGHAFANEERHSFQAEASAVAWEKTFSWLKR